MSAANACVDLDDTDGLLEADRDGLLRAVAMAGAAVRATAAAVEEGALAPIADGSRPRTVIWVANRGPGLTAGAILAAALAGSAGQPIVPAAAPPPWIGPLDVLVAAGDDPADPVLVTAAATAVRRGARVVVAAPYEGPLRDAAAGRAAVLAPRIGVPDEFGLCRYLAAGLATFAAVDPAVGVDLGGLADELDAEALRNSAGREVFTNAAKALAGRMSGRPCAIAGDNPATVALAGHGAAALLRIAGRAVAAVGLADAVAASRAGLLSGGVGDSVDALFHDEEIDGPLPGRTRILALTLADERHLVEARVAGLDEVDVLGAQDVGEGAPFPVAAGGAEQQLAVLALRMEMAAVYLRLAGG